MAFGKYLKETIDDKGITAAELSRRTGIPKTTLSGIFKSDTDKISIELFLNICDALDVDPSFFYRNYKRNTRNSENELSADEQHLIDVFRRLTIKEQSNIIGRAELLAEQHQEAERQDA